MRNAARMRSCAPLPRVTSRSQRRSRACGNTRAASVSPSRRRHRAVARPASRTTCRWWAVASGGCTGGGPGRSYCLWYVSATAQLPHSGTKPQSRHCTWPARPLAIEEEDHLLVAGQRRLDGAGQRRLNMPRLPLPLRAMPGMAGDRLRAHDAVAGGDGADALGQSAPYAPRVACSYETVVGPWRCRGRRPRDRRQFDRGVACR